MPVLSHQRLRRASALAVALCYVWLSAVGSFLHDCVRPNAPTARTISTSSTPATTQVTQESQIAAHNHKAHVCPICEWQATNVSLALPAFEIVSSFSLQQRVITTFPRYLKTVAISTSSRAPPLS